MRKPPAHRLRRKPPFFHPVPLRARSDGWSEVRQCAFLAQLYVTGSVGAAARHVGMARAGAYRLRARAGAEEFAWAWDHVLTPPGSGRRARPRADGRKVTDRTLRERVERGLVKPVIFRGAMVAMQRKADNCALLRLVRRLDGARYDNGAGL